MSPVGTSSRAKTWQLVMAAGLIFAGLCCWLFGLQQIRIANAACTGEGAYLGSYYILPDDGSHPDFEQVLQNLQDIPGQLQPNLVNGLPVRVVPNPPVVGGAETNTSIRRFDWYTSPFQRFTRLDSNPLAFSNDNTPNTRPYFGPGTLPAESAALPANKNIFAVHWRTNLVAPPGGLSIPYSFALDDAGWIFLDGVLQVDHGGIHPPQTFNGTFNIPAGRHTIDIFFADRHTVNAVTNIQLGNLGALLACGSPNLRLTKTVQPTTPVNPGDLLTYTVTIANTGNFTGTNTVIRDAMPTGTSLVSVSPAPASGPPIGGNGELVWNVGTLGVGETRTVTFVARVNSNLPPASLISNRARATSEESGGVVFQSNEVSNVVNAAPVISMNKIAVPPSGSSVDINGFITYTLTVSNIGNVQTSSVTVSDPLPSGTSFVSANPAPSRVNPSEVVWQLPPLAPNTTRDITLVLRVNTRPAATNGLLQNVATADAGARATSPLVTHQVREGVDLSINKRATGVTPPAPPITDGQLISYTVEASNPGPLAATAVTVTDFLPPGTQLVSSTPPTTTQSGQTVNWTFPNLAAGETRQINLTVRVLTGTNAISLTNRARVSSATPEINPVNNDAIADVPGNAAPVDATAQKSGPPRAIAGETFVYRILVTTVNGGDNIVVTDTLPAGLTLVPELTNPPALGTAPTYYWNLGRMAPGTNRTVEVGVRVSPGITVGTTLNNSAEVAGGTGTIRPPRGSNPAQTQIVRPSNLSLSKAVAQPGTFTPGGNVTFTLTVRNNDAVNPSGVITVTDNLPAGFTVVSTNPAANVTGSTVRWNIASVPAGGTLNLLLVAQVPANFTGNSFSNQAQLETDLPDTQPIVTSNPVNVPRFGLTANLAIDKTGPAGPLARGQPFAYTIEVRNDGSVEATGIVISDTLPAGLTYVSASPAPASQNPLRWQIGSLAPNARVNITLIVQLAADYSGSAISNQASVGSQSADGDQTNNFSVRTIPIQAPPASATPAVTALGTTPTPTAAGGGGGGGANTPTPTAATGTTAAVTTVAGSGTPAPNTTVAISATPTATSGGGGDGGTTPGANATPTALPGVPNTGQPPADNSNFDELFWRFMLGLGLIAGGGWLFWSGRRERQRNRN